MQETRLRRHDVAMPLCRCRALMGRGSLACAGAQLQEQVAALKEEYSRLGDAMEKSQGSAMQARPMTNTLTESLEIDVGRVRCTSVHQY